MYREFMISEVSRMLECKNIVHSQELVRDVSIDSRDTGPGDLFFALKGEHTDGHNYIRDALEKGACGVVVTRDIETGRGLVVDDTLYALGSFSQRYRRYFRPVTIGITGTNGKTTVKNLVGRILGKVSKTLTTQKNFNSLIGVPLTLIQLTPEEQYLVVEMGTSNPGEIKRLCEIVQPTHGVITNIGPGHLQGLKSEEGVRKEKLSLIQALPPDGHAIVGEGVGGIDRDNVAYLSACAIDDVFVGEYGSHFRFEGECYYTPLLGIGNVMNCCTALCVTSHIDVPREAQREALVEIKAEPGRMEPIWKNGIFVINDTYNANPVSMKAALSFMTSLPRRGIAILGDMYELGSQSVCLHQEVGVLAQQGCAMVITYGELARHYGGVHFNDIYALVQYVVRQLEGNEAILLKASRGLRFERIVESLLREI